jgi:hypothetical protein
MNHVQHASNVRAPCHPRTADTHTRAAQRHVSATQALCQGLPMSAKVCRASSESPVRSSSSSRSHSKGASVERVRVSVAVCISTSRHHTTAHTCVSPARHEHGDSIGCLQGGPALTPDNGVRMPGLQHWRFLQCFPMCVMVRRASSESPVRSSSNHRERGSAERVCVCECAAVCTRISRHHTTAHTV